MEEQKLYSVILSEKEFGLLSWLDRKWTNFKNWRNRMTARANNAFVNFLGLGNTRVGRGLKGLNNARADIRNRMNEAGYNLRGSILGYNDQDNNMEERQYSILDPRYFSKKDYEGLSKAGEEALRKDRDELARQLWEERKWEKRKSRFKAHEKSKIATSGREFEVSGIKGSYQEVTKRRKNEKTWDFLKRHDNKAHDSMSKTIGDMKKKLRERAEGIKDPIPKESLLKRSEKWAKGHKKELGLASLSAASLTAGSIYAAKKIKEKNLKKKFNHLKDYETL